MTSDRCGLSVEEVWTRYDEMERRLTAPLSERMLDLAGVRSGMRVLDLATGRGEPAIRAAHRVGSTGHVLGIDISASMLAMARTRAEREGLGNLELRAADAGGEEPVGSSDFQATLMRWGLMYMNNPLQVLANVRHAMAPAGRFVMAVWCEPERVPYWSLPRRFLRPDRSLPAVDAARPGPFRYAHLAALERDLRSAGFTIQTTEEVDVTVMEANTTDDAIAWFRAFGLEALLEGLPVEARDAWEKNVTRELETSRRGGRIQVGGVTRIVVASKSVSI